MLPGRFEQQHHSAVSHLSRARSEARELGEERRNEVQKRVKNIKAQQSDEKGQDGGGKLKEPEDER